MFDKGSFTITDDYKLTGEVTGDLLVDKKHLIDLSNLSYHRKSHGFD